MSQSGHVTLVTGGGRGIGAATAELLAGQGHAVCVDYVHDAGAAEDVADRVRRAGGRAIAVRADVAIEDDVLRLFEQVDRELGPVTGLVNNAGIVDVRERLESMSAERVMRMLAVNVLGAFLCAREGVKRMKGRGGAIVNVSSAAARRVGPVRRLRGEQGCDRHVHGRPGARGGWGGDPGQRGSARHRRDGDPRFGR